MMCEVKYKAYWHNSKLTTLVDTIEFLEGGIRVSDGCMHTGWAGSHCTLRQYTGLKKDSHGKEVFEGDIIEAVFELLDGELKTIMDRGVVVKKDYAFQVQMFEGHYDPLHEWERLSEELKVIGNIYENPEMLPEVTE